MNQPNGFVLPLVLVVSLATLFILTPLVARFVTSLDISHATYQARVAKESARAGLAYATACYNESEGDQTWGSAAVGGARPNLTPSTSCTGAANGQSNYLFNNGNVRTSFNVGNITSSDDFGIEIVAQGTADRLGAGTSFLSYSSQLKRVSWGDGVIGSGGGSGSILQVDMGRSHACALVSSGVYCWGSNSWGRLGTGGTPSSSSTPLKVLQEPGVMAGETITQISIGESTTCAVSAGGKLFCWGPHVPFDGWSDNKPVRVGGALLGKSVTAVSVAGDFICAIADGKIYCWGDDEYGLVGPTGPYYFGLGGMGTGTGLHYDEYMLPSSVTTVNTPTLVTSTYLPANYQATKLAHAGAITTQMCAILNTGQMYCWGGNRNSELGANIGIYVSGYYATHYRYVDAPYPVYNNGYLDSQGVTAVATNGTTYNASNVSCAISNGYPYCTRSHAYPPTPAPGRFERITAGSYVRPVFDIATGGQGQHTCALAQNGLYCWSASHLPGSPWYNSSNNDPVHIPTLGGQPTTNLVSVTAYWNDVCGLYADAHLYCWNGLGQSGNGSLTNLTEITQVYNLVHGLYF